MFFPLSKLIYFVITPSNFFILAGLVGCALLFGGWTPRLGRGLALVGFAGLLIGGLLPVASWITLPLEERFQRFTDDGAPVTGIIVLGGAVETRTTLARDQISVNEAGERPIAFADLARRYPRARLLFSGGSGLLVADAKIGDGTSEAEVVGRFADSLGLPRTRLIQEDRSRNTHENARFSADLVKPQPGEHWLLVTSAWHMPRAVGCFRKAGFEVTAYPVDYRTASWRDAFRFNAFASDGLLLLDVVVKEWLGLVAYRLAGYTDALLPAPHSSPTAAAGIPSR